MSSLFISHSHKNNAEALALAVWMNEKGWNDLFLDISEQRGIQAGERWQNSLKNASYGLVT